MKQVIVMATTLLVSGNTWSMPDPVYEYESVLRAYLVVQRCALDDTNVNAGFTDASIHFTAGEFVSREGAAAMRASLGSQIRHEWDRMSREQRQDVCATKGQRYAEQLRDLLFGDSP